MMDLFLIFTIYNDEKSKARKRLKKMENKTVKDIERKLF